MEVAGETRRVRQNPKEALGVCFRHSPVTSTANDAYMRDYELVVPSDCVASETEEAKRTACALMKRFLRADVRRWLRADILGEKGSAR